MNNKEFITTLAERNEFTPAETQRLVNHAINVMGDLFMEGDSVQIANFGTYEVKKKMERIFVNPTTGKRMLVPPKLVLGFKPSPLWKDEIKNGGTK